MKVTKAVASAAVALGILGASQGAAHADNGSWHSFTGTVYENGDWYKSSTIRTVGPTATSISVIFATLPGGGVDFDVVDYATGQWHGILYGPAVGPSYELSAGDVWYGKQFQNNFRLVDTNTWSSDYNFSGSENY